MTQAVPESVNTSTLRKVITAASIGNFVEWFDFAVYGFLATIIAEQFFPSGDPKVALLKTFAVFAVAFAFRPLGGIVFGMLGDRIGRKKILALTILLMAGATTLIGLLPTYASIGVLAPLMLTVIRCVQGFSAGGEYAGACAYVMEHAPRTQRATYGSFIPVSTFSAFACAAVIAYALNATLSQEVMASWGWRIPFLIAAPLGIVGLYLRMRLSETPAFQSLEAQHEVAHAPLRETLKSHGGAMCRLGAFISVTALSFYMFTTYFATYLQVAGGLDRASALLITVIALLFAAAFCPVAGRFSDRVGRRATIATTCLLLIVVVYPSFMMASSGAMGLSIIGVLLLAVGAVLSGVVTAALLSETFPTRTRYTASAITYNMAYTIFGGTAPLMATYLINETGSNLAPAYYLILISVMGLIGGIMLPETSKISLGDAGAPTTPPLASASTLAT
ncbi:MHS family proline/betaine transporter-like MFS transporter [Pseudomonas duriflava]|uniref:MHS family proline/betaine transporter-like MFS transporter n=1 Tax=Pseudomonas duriflava TaxID=459528 RepID=A0A562Q2L3_9PSED|nr:MFS transporter [Pseudomonas duriflava]TWI50925.1 MHS family proline/betaine transporter-like MFS transporter [Pseudomonas duriflava]